MNKVYFHSPNNYHTLTNIMLSLFIPFLMYGFYKNGISLYINKYVSLLMLFKPIFFVLIAIIISIIFSKINKTTFREELLPNIIIAMITTYNTNVLIFAILLIICNIIKKYLKINIIPIYMLINYLILIIMKNTSFLNYLELNNTFDYSLLDYLIGKSIGGISNTFIIMDIISLIILCSNINYKKYIPLVSLSIFYFLLFITSFIKGTFALNLFLNSNLLFAIIFICPLSLYSPYSKGACYIYGMLLGLLCFACSFLNLNMGIYLIILLLSLISPLLDKFIVRN